MRRQLTALGLAALLLTVGVVAPTSAAAPAEESRFDQIATLWKSVVARILEATHPGQPAAPEGPQNAEGSSEEDGGPSMEPGG